MTEIGLENASSTSLLAGGSGLQGGGEEPAEGEEGQGDQVPKVRYVGGFPVNVTKDGKQAGVVPSHDSCPLTSPLHPEEVGQQNVLPILQN